MFLLPRQGLRTPLSLSGPERISFFAETAAARQSGNYELDLVQLLLGL